MKKKKWDPAAIPVGSIDADPENQPRREMDAGQIKRIADELRAGGIIRMPVLVVMNEDSGRDFTEEPRYTLFDGFHRYEAAVRAGAETIPAEIVASPQMAYQMAGESNAHGTRWTSKEARAHIAQGIRNGTYVNTNGVPWPLSVMAEKFVAYGVTRRNLTIYLDNLAKEDEQIAEAMVLIRATYDKQNQHDAPQKSKKELAELATEKRCRIARSYLARAMQQMETIPVEKRREVLAAYGLAKVPRGKPPATSGR